MQTKQIPVPGEFIKYQHIERLGTDNEEIKGLLDGEVYLFSKIDGSNLTVWLNKDNEVCVGRREGQISSKEVDIGLRKMYDFVTKNEKYKNFLLKHPTLYLYGEFLSKHKIRSYFPDAWDKLYVFDVYDSENDKYLSLEEYVPILEEFNIVYIPLVKKVTNPTFEYIVEIAKHTKGYLQDEVGIEEGLIAKNYNYKNPWGRSTWGKYVLTRKNLGGNKYKDSEPVEVQIVYRFLPEEFIEKEYNKLVVDQGMDPNENKMKFRNILLASIWRTFIIEECWNFVKKMKNPQVNFGQLKHLVEDKIKEVEPQVFEEG